MYLGVDYYPEQWGLELIDEDLSNIKELGCNIIRIADFVWDMFEPLEDQYDFSFFDQVIEKCRQYDLKVMMCVPTATMPRWLNLKYPEVMSNDQYGHRQPFGGRRGYCYNSDRYIQKALALTEALAKHYKNEKQIVAWQLDNEIGHEGSDMCFCKNCQKKFISYLKEKYDDIEQLNKRWGTAFWSGSYVKFEDMQLPKKAHTAQNPSLHIEWERFRSISISNFLISMYQVLKNIIPEALVLHNLEGGTLDKHFDPFDLARKLDDIAYNNYPVWGGLVEPLKPYEVALALDMARGFRQDRFWITEQIMGAQGHDIIGCAVKPNQGATWAIQAFGHGCKAMLIFRYRGFNKGAEQYCFGILDSDNRKKRKYYEVLNLFKYLKENKEVFNIKVKAKAAVVFDYDSASCFKSQRQSDSFNYVNEMTKLYKQLWMRDIPVDIIVESDDLSQYELVILPYMIMMKESFVEKLKEYVRSGGQLVLTARSSWKDQDNNFVLNQDLPLYLTDLSGIIVDQQESLLADTCRECIDLDNRLYKGYVFKEMLLKVSAEELVKWHNCPFGNYSAVTVNYFGQGKCYYLASSFEEELMEKLFDEITGQKIVKGENQENIDLGNNITLFIDYENFKWELNDAADKTGKS
ncbi:MAG TPA: beta-galactosidase [Erysipelotrichaceae bacterium]|nr:beta-galactosidase [Erysipelotrichaceae bacterium]